MNKSMTRRQVFITGIKIATAIAPTSFLLGCGTASQPSAPTKESMIQPSVPTTDLSKTEIPLDTRLHQELLASSKFANVCGQWTEREFNDFIDSMGQDSLKRTCKTLSISPASVEDYVSNPIMKKEIKKTIANLNGGILGTDSEKILYHEQIVRPTARNLKLDDSKINTYDTLNLERAIYNKVFEQSWTSLTEDQRINFLQQSKWDLKQNTIVSLAALTGTGILAGLSEVVSLSGFSFYIGMSQGLFALASSLGITLPFAIYTSASTAIALATGPIGWVAAAVLAVVGVYEWIKRDKSTKEADMLKTVLHFHDYKISAMQEANIAFSVKGV